MSKAIEVKSKLLNGKKFKSKSQMIKQLHFGEGYDVAKIAKEEGILYQMVRNIVTIEKNARFYSENKPVEVTSEEAEQD